MKRIALSLAFLAACGLLSACGSGAASSSPASSAPAASSAAAASAAPAQAASGSRTLIVYFTPGENMGLPDNADTDTHASIRRYDGHITGDAGVMAQLIAKHTGGTLFSIRTEKTYPASYQGLLDIGQEEKGNNERPRLTSTLTGLENYDTVFLVYPMWWHDLPMAVHTFLDSYDLSGKTIIPYALHGGSGPETSTEIIQSAEPNAKVLTSGAANGYFTDDLMTLEPNLVRWLKSMGYEK